MIAYVYNLYSRFGIERSLRCSERILRTSTIHELHMQGVLCSIRSYFGDCDPLYGIRAIFIGFKFDFMLFPSIYPDLQTIAILVGVDEVKRQSGFGFTTSRCRINHISNRCIKTAYIGRIKRLGCRCTLGLIFEVCYQRVPRHRCSHACHCKRCTGRTAIRFGYDGIFDNSLANFEYYVKITGRFTHICHGSAKVVFAFTTGTGVRYSNVIFAVNRRIRRRCIAYRMMTTAEINRRFLEIYLQRLGTFAYIVKNSNPFACFTIPLANLNSLR